MIRKLVKFAVRSLLLLLVLACAAAIAFRLAAALRETADRDQIMPASGKTIATRSGRIFIQDKGDTQAIPVVLIHGTAAWSQLWWRTTDALTSSGFRVIALDLPPFGFSDRPGDYTRGAQAARIDNILTTLGVTKAIIVGHSFGAGTALEYVMRHPDRTRGLVLVDAALGLTAPPSDPPWLLHPRWIRELLVSLTVTNPLATKTLLSQLIANKAAADAQTIGILQTPMRLKNSTADIADWLLYFTSADRGALSADRRAVAGIAAPTALLWGDKDTVTPLAQARDLQTLLPKASLDVLPGLGHIPQIEDSIAFNKALIAALRGM
ncbi:alpha/beta hydrolase [Bradyrhizobium prioriisuperbiae]|uniref:alpha/beta fold hydrolase n=1 Tax=Bradyrhizobium prioriisuperbiae TaxID=2854389 RepID=UPI0028E87501|nr:alpha/beta hydrolase [Bradyrhizobium prioritasuperba]